jgi:hypothetical protein
MNKEPARDSKSIMTLHIADRYLYTGNGGIHSQLRQLLPIPREHMDERGVIDRDFLTQRCREFMAETGFGGPLVMNGFNIVVWAYCDEPIDWPDQQPVTAEERLAIIRDSAQPRVA